MRQQTHFFRERFCERTHLERAKGFFDYEPRLQNSFGSKSIKYRARELTTGD